MTNADGTGLAGVKVSFAVVSGGGTVGSSEATSNADGVANVSRWTLGGIVGKNLLQASVPGLSKTVSFEANTSAGAAVQLALHQGNQQHLPNGGVLPIDPAVKVTDSFGNSVAGVSVKFDVVSVDGIVFIGSQAVNNRSQTVVTDAAGIASVRWGLTGVSTSYSITATAAGLSGSPVTFTATSTPNGQLVESILNGLFRIMVNTYSGLAAVAPLSTQARTYTASWNNFSMNFYSSVDNPASPPDQWHRQSRPWQNNATAVERDPLTWQWSGYMDLLSQANSVLLAIRSGGAVLGNTSNTKRAETIAVLMQGMAFMAIALNHDKGIIITETTPGSNIPPYSNRKEMRDAALARFAEAVGLANANAFITPAIWTNGVTYSNTAIARIANTLAAMTLVFYARDAAENAAVNWAQVATLASAGMSTGTPIEFTFVGNGCVSFCPEALSWFNAIDIARVSTRVANLLDPATQQDPWPLSGNAKPNSLDRRLGDGTFGTSTMQSGLGTVAKTASGGSDFAWSSIALFPASRGSYHQSNLAHIRWDASGMQQTGIVTGHGSAPIVTATVNDLLWAEASLRTGNHALAATLINKTRVGRGNLAPITTGAGGGADTEGPCNALGKLAKDGTTNCTLMAALLYEMELELLGLGAVPFYNQRRLSIVTAGGRYVQGLLSGTPREMPVPYNVLAVRGEALYTWGGTGAANSPTPP